MKIKILIQSIHAITKLQSINRAAIVLYSVLLSQSLELSVQAQPAPEVVIDRIFRSDESSSSNSKYQISPASLKQWMGAYQRIRKEGNIYIVIFDRGSLPIEVRFKANGSVEGVGFGCPVSKSLSLGDAPSDLQRSFSKCTGFRS
jgi:hypothetical protein